MAARTVAVTKVTPLSAFRVGLAMALVGLVAWLITAAALYFGMERAGIWDSVNSLIGDVGGERAIDFGFVMSIAALIGAIMAIFVAILAPLGALVYNAIHDLFGGFVVRLADQTKG